MHFENGILLIYTFTVISFGLLMQKMQSKDLLYC